jgi:hypothetical protein
MPSTSSSRRPTLGTTIVFILAVFMCVLSVVAVVFWTPIDDAFIDRAEAAGDMGLLLPHQHGLWVVLHALAFGAFLLSVFAFVLMWKSRPGRPSSPSGRQPSVQLHPPLGQSKSTT